MRKLLQLICKVVAMLLCAVPVFGQNIDFTLRYNEITAKYEVYGKPDFDDPFFFAGGGNQVSLVFPHSISDAPIAIQTVNGGLWLDNSQIYAPLADTNHDFHGIASNGSGVTFVQDEELLLFTFSLTGNPCVTGIRLFENDTDPQSTEPGMGGGDFSNYFANVFDFQNYYRGTYDNAAIICQEPPFYVPTNLVVTEDSMTTLCMTIFDVNIGDTFTSNLCDPNPLNGTATTTITGDQLCVTYTPDPGYIGDDEICIAVCDQTNLCYEDTIPVSVLPIFCPDLDNDGVCDQFDNCPNISNPLQLDCDNDGEGDLCELDSDNDSIPDDCDICIGNDAAGDTDGDGICDDIDNCLFIPNPLQLDCDNDGEGDICEIDTDGDSIPDACDVCEGDDGSGDTDGDGICDDIDNCVSISNHTQLDCDNNGVGDSCELDTDNDSIPDTCDVCEGDDTTGDTDGDGLCDDIDNCVNLSNPLQLDCDNDGVGNLCEPDTDNDGIPDGCDLCVGDDSSGDTDGDGICDSLDNCVNTPNPAQADCTGDGIGDACEQDTDGDNVPDDCDICLGNDAFGDDDGDGICNLNSNCDVNEVVIGNDGTECVQPFTDINLFANVIIPNANLDFYTFNWTGENNFSSSSQNPILPNIENDDSGTYTVTVTNVLSSCQFVLSTVVDVTVIPSEPQITATTELACLGSEYILTIPAYEGTDVHYEWMGPKGTTSSGAYPDQATLLISNFDNTDVGAYNVQVIVDECSSLTASNVTVDIQPLLDAPQIIGDTEVCENSVISLMTPVVADEYIWTGPNGFTSNLQNPAITFSSSTQHVGDYNLEVVLNGCNSPVSTVAVSLSEYPTDPILEMTSDVCIGDDIVMSVVSANAISYQWIAPSATSNSSFGTLGDPNNVLWTTNPSTTISMTTNPELYESGTWRVQAINAAGCISTVSIPQMLTINEPPAEAIISAEGDVCENEPIYLHASPVANVNYRWYDGDPAGTPTGTLVATGQDPILFNVTPGLHKYYALAEKEGCEADTYGTVEVLVKNKPELNVVANAGPFCVGESILLGTPAILGATYFWYGPNGYSSNAQNPIISNATTADEGTYLLVVEIEGCASDPLSTEVILSQEIEVPIATNNGPACIGNELLLLVENPNPNLTYEWFDSNGNISIGTGTEFLMEDIDMESSGIYYVIASNGNCSSDLTQSTGNGENAYTTVAIEQADSDVAYVGEALFTCENSININATPISNGTGFWSVLNGGSNTTILQPSQPSSMVMELEEGINELVWTVNSSSCGTASTDTLLVEFGSRPIAEDDVYEIDDNSTLENMRVFDNDLPNTSEFEISIISENITGNLVLQDDNLLSYWPQQGFIGTETFEYRICHKHCPDLCDEGSVTIEVEGEGCEAGSVMTPNNDGYNDTFIITCIPKYQGSSLSIFNRWGDEIYFSPDYKNDWEGTHKGEDLPTGTYFYNLKLNDNQNTSMSGFIYIEK